MLAGTFHRLFMGKLQQILSSTMQKVGSVVEKVAASAGRNKKPKPKKTGVTDETGQDFAFVSWDEKQLHTLLNVAERKELLPLIPNLAGKKILHLTPGKESYVEIIAKRGAQDLVELDVATATAAATIPSASPFPFARGSADHLPFRPDSFDFIVYASALAWRSDLPAVLPEISRCLKDNGRLLLSVVHPFFEYLMNPRGGFRKTIESVFESLKENGFFIEDLKEGKLDDALRYVSLSQKLMKELQRFQGLPVVLVLKAIRLRKKKT